MGVRILSAKEFTSRLKATIQATGKLGFTDETAKALSLSSEKFIRIAYDDETDVFYLAVMPGKDSDAFKVCSAGDYFYLPTTSLFRAMGVDFESTSIIFDLSRDSSLDETLGGIAYKMTKRIGERRKSKM